jgi:hypothetical protein
LCFLFLVLAENALAQSGLRYQCAPDAQSVTLSWNSTSQLYYLRLDDTSNNDPSCPDGWQCGGTDTLVDSLAATSAILVIIPGTLYDWWLHGFDGRIGPAVHGPGFVCYSGPPWPQTTYELTWVGSVVDETHDAANQYVIYRAANGAELAVNHVPAEVLSYTDTLTFPAGTEVCYTVAAMNDFGQSPRSNEICQRIPPTAQQTPNAPASTSVQ